MLISPVSSALVSPVPPVIAYEFRIVDAGEKALVMSVFLLAYAIGPFVMVPLSEVFGRVVVLQSSNLSDLVFKAACGFAEKK